MTTYTPGPLLVDSRVKCAWSSPCHELTEFFFVLGCVNGHITERGMCAYHTERAYELINPSGSLDILQCHRCRGEILESAHVDYTRVTQLIDPVFFP